jgi:N6-L-threonylcarbamoyladenine synthase
VLVLAIESSCDETAAAVVEDGRSVLSSIVASQMSTHGKYGGVVPELASREHLRAIVPVVREALERAGSRLEDLAAIAVTVGPGLVGSLLVGLTYAKSLSFASGVPLIAVNHIEGHIHAVILEAGAVELPALALVIRLPSYWALVIREARLLTGWRLMAILWRSALPSPR